MKDSYLAVYEKIRQHIEKEDHHLYQPPLCQDSSRNSRRANRLYCWIRNASAKLKNKTTLTPGTRGGDGPRISPHRPSATSCKDHWLALANQHPEWLEEYHSSQPQLLEASRTPPHALSDTEEALLSMLQEANQHKHAGLLHQVHTVSRKSPILRPVSFGLIEEAVILGTVTKPEELRHFLQQLYMNSIMACNLSAGRSRHLMDWYDFIWALTD